MFCGRTATGDQSYVQGEQESYDKFAEQEVVARRGGGHPGMGQCRGRRRSRLVAPPWFVRWFLWKLGIERIVRQLGFVRELGLLGQLRFVRQLGLQRIERFQWIVGRSSLGPPSLALQRQLGILGFLW